MIEALILIGVLSGNADRRAEFDVLDEEARWVDWVILSYILLAIFLWPIYGVVFAARLGLWYLGLIPIFLTVILFATGLLWLYGLIGLLVAMLEYSRLQAS